MLSNIQKIDIPEGKYVYFASDFHFGIPDQETSRKREIAVCQWLENIQQDAHCIFLLGDIWDAWMEYKRVIPKGTTRFLGKLAQLSDAGIQLFIFTGNHDLWMRDYFKQELNIEIIHTHQTFQLNQKIVHMGHGDGIGPGDKRYKFLKALLRNPACQWIYRQIHPDIGLGLAKFFSELGPKHKYEEIEFLGEEKEFQMLYAKKLLETSHYDYFIFGHRHIPNLLLLNNKSYYVNLGDWLQYKTYARLGDTLELLSVK